MKLKELLDLIPALPWHLTVDEDSNSDGITENVAVIYDHENLGEEIVRTVTHSDAPDEGAVHEGAMLNAQYLHHAANTLPELVNAAKEMADNYCAVRCGHQDHTPICARMREALAKSQEVKMENEQS